MGAIAASLALEAIAFITFSLNPKYISDTKQQF